MHAPCSRISALALSLTAAAATAQDAQTHLLRFVHQPGSRTFYRRSEEVRARMDLGDVKVDATMSVVMTLEFEVVGVTDGVADVRQTVHRLQLQMDNSRMQVDYDSDDPKSDAGAMAEMTDIVGKSFRMKIDARGRVSDLQAPKDAGAAVAGDLARQVGQGLPQLPEEPVALGAGWDTRVPLALGQGGSGDVKVTSRLDRIDGAKAFLTQQLDIDTSRLPAGAKVAVQKAAGSTVLDLAAGRLVESRTDLEMTVTAEQLGRKVESHSKVTMRMEAIEPPPRKGDAGGGRDR